MVDPSAYLMSLGDSLDSLCQRLPVTDSRREEVVRAVISAHSLAAQLAGSEVAQTTVERIVTVTNEVSTCRPTLAPAFRGAMDSVWALLENLG